jgi:hypothetical protein
LQRGIPDGCPIVAATGNDIGARTLPNPCTSTDGPHTDLQTGYRCRERTAYAHFARGA